VGGRTHACVTVIERSPTFRANGQGIDLRTAGVQVTRKIPGMEAAVCARTTTEEGVCLLRSTRTGPPARGAAYILHTGRGFPRRKQDRPGLLRGGAGGRFLSIGPDHSRRSKVCLISALPKGERDAIAPFLTASKQGDDAALKRYVVSRFGGAGWKSAEILGWYDGV